MRNLKPGVFARRPLFVEKRFDAFDRNFNSYFNSLQVDDALEPILGTPEDFAAQIATDLANWAKLIKSVNVKVD